MNVITFGELLSIVFLINAETNPTCSANPIPKVITKTKPKGENPVKFFIVFCNIKLIPSLESKFFTLTTSFFTGSTTSIPK